MMSKPIRSLELHYPVIQFLINSADKFVSHIKMNTSYYHIILTKIQFFLVFNKSKIKIIAKAD